MLNNQKKKQIIFFNLIFSYSVRIIVAIELIYLMNGFYKKSKL